MKKLNILKMPIALLLSLVLSAACTKKRDAELPYGEDRDLQALATFEGKEWDLTTFDVIKVSDSSAKLRLADERKNATDKIKTFNYVRYKSEDPLKLTDDTLMLGLPNHQYKVKYLFEGTLLKVMKLAPPEDLSSDEKTVAVDNKDGRLMVPIVSYSVSLYSVDRTRNDQNETTSRLELIAQQNLSSATHFKIDLNSKTRASFLSKTTVLPANFFTGEKGDSADWYYSMTLVSQNSHEADGADSNGLAFPGVNHGVDKYQRNATKIRAKKLENKIVFYNLGIDHKLEKSIEDRVENQATVLTLPVDFIDYELSVSGKASTVKEEASKEKAWNQRAYMDMKLTEVKVAYWEFQISELRDVQIGDNYFSFTVKDEASGSQIRFSFYNVKTYQRDAAQKFGAQPYQPKILFPEDEKLFGFFSVTPEKNQSFEKSLKDRADRANLIKRFNPTRSVIEYRINQDAPKWTEDIAKTAVSSWNSALKAAGLSTRIRITDEKGQVLRGQVGDLRYSLLNFMTETDRAAYGWFGVGPSIADPSTGEIVMATTNVNTGSHTGVFKQVLYQYLRSSQGLLSDKYLMGFSFPGLKIVEQAAQNVVEVISKGWSTNRPSQLQKVRFYDERTQQFRKDIKIVTKQAALEPNSQSQTPFENTVEILERDIIESARNMCPDLKTYADQIKGQKDLVVDVDKEVQLISACADAVAKAELISTVVHEMGHNLGLTHNFYGSTDARNYYAPISKNVNGQQVQVQWKSSSVMDYMVASGNAMVQPGRYDIAAIRWGYLDRIELESGPVVVADPTKPTKPKFTKEMRKFKFCQDSDLTDAAMDPLCGTFDSGSDPEMIVDNLIQSYEAHIALANNRLGYARIKSYFQLALERQKSFLIPMQKFYEMWRLIVAREAGTGQEYLEAKATAADYDDLLKRLFDENKQGKEQAQWNRKYYNAAKKIFDLMVRIAFMPDASCVTTRMVNGNETIQLYSLVKLQKDVFLRTTKTIKSCADREAQDYLKQTYGATVVAQGGLPFNNLYHDLSVARENESNGKIELDFETVGLAQDRYLALTILTGRSQELRTSRIHDFAPNFVDEWPFREELKRRITDRLTKGVSIRDLKLDREFKAELPEDMHSLNFAVEKALLNEMTSLYKGALAVPGKGSETIKRLLSYQIKAEHKIKRFSGVECVQLTDDDYCASKNENPEAYSLVRQYKALQTKKNAWKISQTSLETFQEIVLKSLPEKGHGMDATFEFYNILDKKMDEIRDKDKQLHRDLEELATIFKPEYDIFAAATKIARSNLSDKDLSKADRDKEYNQLFTVKLLDQAKRIGKEKDFKALDQETAKARISEFLQKARNAYEEYQADPTEYDAQADIILNALATE